MLSSGMLRREALVRTDVSEERIRILPRLLFTANADYHPADGSGIFLRNAGS
jgi:hypothetical protein